MKNMIEMSKIYLYHFVGLDTYKYIKKYGLCSPQCLYDRDMDLFMKTSYPIYKRRTSEWLNKTDISAEDIINYLNKNPKRKMFTSKALFFTLITLEEHNIMVQKEMKPCIQLSIDSKWFKERKPLIVGPKGKRYYSNWKEILNIDFIDYVKINSLKRPEDSNLIFKYCPHICISDMYNIPFGLIDKIKIYK